MIINNNYIELPDENNDLYRQAPNFFEENEFINNLMLNPGKYRDFKRNINRINNIDNEINYLKSIEKKNQIDFVSNIKITQEEYENALKDADIIFENLNEEQIGDLLSHKKLLSNEKHLMETMVYFFGSDNFDWNTFKITFSLYDAKTKMKSVDYSKIRKKKINLLLGQICRSDKNNGFLNMNDFCDSGMEFVFEWVKCQLKIYFYLYQNKKIPRIKVSKSMSDVYNNNLNFLINKKININAYELKNNLEEKATNISSGLSHINSSNFCSKNNKQIENLILKNSTNIESLNNTNNNININNKVKYSNNISKNLSFMNTINRAESSNPNGKYNLNQKRSSNLFNKKNNNNNINNYNISKAINENNNKLLLTSLPDIMITRENKNEHADEASFLPYRKNNKIFVPKEAKKINIKIKGVNKETEKIFKEIKTAEMLPLLKNKTFHQMRQYFEEKMPFNRKIDKKIKDEINSYSLNGTNDEIRLISLIAGGKIKALNYETLFKLKKTLGS